LRILCWKRWWPNEVRRRWWLMVGGAMLQRKKWHLYDTLALDHTRRGAFAQTT
jgi:hypothetical protein